METVTGDALCGQQYQHTEAINQKDNGELSACDLVALFRDG